MIINRWITWGMSLGLFVAILLLPEPMTAQMMGQAPQGFQEIKLWSPPMALPQPAVPPINFPGKPEKEKEKLSRIEKLMNGFLKDSLESIADPDGKTIRDRQERKYGDAAKGLEKTEVGDEVEDEEEEAGTILRQFGYDFFQSLAEVPATDFPPDPNYILGPGDQFVITLWGLVEGIYSVVVSNSGTITLPKAGVIPVAGVRFGDIEAYIGKQLRKYYKDFNISVAMGQLRSIRVYVVGEVHKPGLHRMTSVSSVVHALAAAGGPTKRGSLRSIQIQRDSDESKEVDLYDFFISGERGSDLPLQDGDTVFVPIIGPVVTMAGNVYRPAIYEIKEGLQLGKALQLAGGILPVGYLHKVQIERIEAHQRRIILDHELLPGSVDEKKLASLDLPLLNMDIVKVKSIYSEIVQKVTLSGHVKHPGDYEFKKGMKISEILKKDQLTRETYLDRVEIVRVDPDTLQESVLSIDLRALLSGDSSQDIPLEGRDNIQVFSEDRGPYKVLVKGEVLRPGEYIITKGETLGDLLKRTGGFTDEAFPTGLILKRNSLIAQQQKSLEETARRLELDLLRRQATSFTSISSEAVQREVQDQEVAKQLLERLKSNKEGGRIIVKMNADLDKFLHSENDPPLHDKDFIEVPRRSDTVLLLGAVYSPSAVVWQPDFSTKDYIRSVGGFMKTADKKETYILRTNGEVLSRRNGRVMGAKLEPGDVVSVPEKVQRKGEALITVRDLTQIIFQLGTTTALFLAAF